MTRPLCSILLPTLNAAETLPDLLEALRAQELRGQFELLAIDSSSTDATRALLEEFGADCEVIPAEEFGHGRTRNRAARRARGEFLVFLSQDSIPQGPQFLTQLLVSFDDPRVAGTYARVMADTRSDPLAVRTVLELPEASEVPGVRDLDHVEGVWDLSGEERGTYLRFNNVASAVRAEVFREIPLPEVGFGEDFAWAARILTAGHRIAFAPQAVARHVHEYSMGSAYRRYRLDAEFHAQIHGWRMRPSLAAALKGLAYELYLDARWLARERPSGTLLALLRAPGLRGAQILGQYLGSRGRGPQVWQGAS